MASPTATSVSGSTARIAEKLCTYNQRRPLAITRQALTTRLSANELRGVTVHSITYASPKGGEVPTLLVVPNARGPLPGIIVQHGLPSTKEDFLPVGIDLARTGAVAILIDAPFNRPQQGTVRGDLSGTPNDPQPPLSAEEWERWLAAMRPIEPINFIGRAAPAALLFQAGTKDELVPPEDARRYQQAASEPKEIRWCEAGHELNCTARTDMMTWLARHIRIDPTPLPVPTLTSTPQWPSTIGVPGLRFDTRTTPGFDREGPLAWSHRCQRMAVGGLACPHDAHVSSRTA